MRHAILVSGSPFDRVWIVRRFEAAPPGAQKISRLEAAFHVDTWFASSCWGLYDLRAMMCETLHRAPNDDYSARAWVKQALERGDLIAYRAPDAIFAAPRAREEPEEKKAAREAAPKEDKTWLVIELVDDDEPPKPVPFRKYRVELPDSSVREGMLDAHGRARIAGIDPGTCKVTFPGLHGEDWRQVA